MSGADRHAWLLDGLVRGYRLLLRAYPASFRRVAARDMAEVFRDLAERQLRRRGLPGLARFALHALLEAPRNGLAERWRRRDASRGTASRGTASSETVSPDHDRPGRAPARHPAPKGSPALNQLASDLRYALRSLARQPLFTLLVVGMLALGIAGNVALFGVFNALFLKPLPFPDAERLVSLDEIAPRWDLDYVSIAYPDFHAWRRDNRTFEGMAVWDDSAVNLAMGDGAIRVDAAEVTHDMAEVLAIEPVVGRDLTAEDDAPGATPVVLLGHDLWRNRFGADPGVLGQTVRLDAEAHTVVGVLPAAAAFLGDADLWVPLAATPEEHTESYYLKGIGRLRPGVDVERAREDLTRVHRSLVEERPVNETTSPRVDPLLERYLGPIRLGTTALLGVVGVVLLIACANVAGLMLARGTGRTREIAVRAALGAGRRRIVQQLLTESLMLAAGGAVVGGLGGVGILRALLSVAPDDLPGWVSFGVDLRFLAFTIVLTGVAALLFGLVPALRVARTDVQATLRVDSGRSSLDRGRRWLLDGLTVAEVGLAVVLLVGAGLYVRGFLQLQNVDPGFRSSDVLQFQVDLPEASHAGDEAQAGFYRSLLGRIRGLPGVRSAAAVTNAPLGGHSGFFVEVEGAPERDPDTPNPVVLERRITDGYLRTMGITLVRGRGLEEAESLDPELGGTILVNETFVRRLLPEGSDPLGQRVRYGGSPWLTIVGVTRDVRHYGLDQEMRPGIYVSFYAAPGPRMSVVAHTAVEPASITEAVRQTVRDLDPELPIFGVVTMSQALEDSLFNRRAATWVFGIFAAVALLMASGGLYGVMSYAVGQQSREIGIRRALGARSGGVVWRVLRRGLTLTGAGLLLGIPAAWGTATLLSSLLLGVRPDEPAVYVGVTTLLVAVAVLANLMPARRAAAINPMEALRRE